MLQQFRNSTIRLPGLTALLLRAGALALAFTMALLSGAGGAPSAAAQQWDDTCTDNDYKIRPLTAAHVGRDRITVSWPALNCPGDYVVRYWQKERKSRSFVEVAVPRDVTTYTATDLAADTAYTVRVLYRDPSGGPPRKASPRLMVDTAPAPQLASANSDPETWEVEITAVAVLRDSINVQWTALDGASQYQVRWHPKGQPEQQLEATTTQTSHTMGNLLEDVTYVVHVEPILRATTQEIRTLLVSTDYDTDDDGLIEVSSLAQLNAIRWDLNGDGSPDTDVPWGAYNNEQSAAGHGAAYPDPLTGMGCPSSGCKGYELVANLDFDTNGNGRADAGDAYWRGGRGWLPIMGVHYGTIYGPKDRDFRHGAYGQNFGNVAANRARMFTAVFEGNGHTIANLYINEPHFWYVGLFGYVAHGTVRNVGLTAPNADSRVTGVNNVGALVGSLERSQISGSYAELDVSATADYAGGLVGYHWRGGAIKESYATGDVSARRQAGGLVGETRYTISASYATGDVSAENNVGGLVGRRMGGGIIASYATGDATATSSWGLVGGMVGSYHHGESPVGSRAGYATGTVTRPPSGNASGWSGYCFPNVIVSTSYWDTQTTGQSSSQCGAAGKTTAELQTPTGYTGIYANWNVDVDGDRTPDDPWDFGTSSQYPVLKYGSLDPAKQRP